jgi:hypothetical protein
VIESPLHKIYRVRKCLFKNPPYRVSLAAVDPMEPCRQTVSLYRLRPSSVLRSFEPHPHGRLKTQRVGRLLASIFPLRCIPALRRHLQYMRPTVYPSVPPFAKKYFANAAPAPLLGEYQRVFSRKKHIG